MTRGQSTSLGVKPHLWHKTRFLLLSDSCGFVDVGHPLWREDRSVVYNCCWPLPMQSFSGLSPAGLMTVLYTISDLRLPEPGGPGSCSYIPQEQGGPVIPPGTGFCFCHLWLAGLQWRCLHPPPHRQLPWVYSLYRLGTDRIENTVSLSSVVGMHIHCHGHMFISCYLATTVSPCSTILASSHNVTIF
jgi:hypothetical protein